MISTREKQDRLLNMKVAGIAHNLHVLLVTLESGAVGPGQVASRASGIIVRNGCRVQDVRSRYQ